MSTTRLLGLATAIAALALMPRVTAAQLNQAVILTPYAGAFVPTNDLASGPVVGKQQAAIVYGVNASAWMSDRFALEAGAAYAMSNTTGTFRTLQPSATRDAHVWLGSLKLMTQLLPPQSKYNLRFGIGPALVTRSGKAFQADANGEVSGLTDIGAAMSLCTRIPLKDNVGLRLRAENFLYQAKLRYDSRVARANDLLFPSKVQNDLVFSIGFQFMSKS